MWVKPEIDVQINEKTAMCLLREIAKRRCRQ